MSEEQKKLLEQQLWNIADELREKMSADEFINYILGFIFFKYLSEKQYIYANELLETESVKDYLNVTDTDDLAAIRDDSLIKLGYFLKPNELFSAIAKRGNANTEDKSNFILEDLDLSSTKLGRTVEARNTLIAKVLSHLDKIDFELKDADSDVLGDAYEYLIGKFASGAGKKAGEFYTPQQVRAVSF